MRGQGLDQLSRADLHPGGLGVGRIGAVERDSSHTIANAQLKISDCLLKPRKLPLRKGSGQLALIPSQRSIANLQSTTCTGQSPSVDRQS
jgi:hypothetical protein